MLASIATTALAVSAPASASPIFFELTGGKTASFTIDTDAAPDTASTSAFGDQIFYNVVNGSFGGTAGAAGIGFGTSIFAQLNILGTPLGFTQYGGPDLFSIVNSKPVFNLGTYSLSSITSGPASITISTGGVPESGTWALMLLGFGAVGFAMRSARHRQSVAVRFA